MPQVNESSKRRDNPLLVHDEFSRREHRIAKQSPGVVDAPAWPCAAELTAGHLEKYLLSRLWES
jgi:hypothetical protein